MKEFVLNLKEKTAQHWFSKKYYKYFMT